MKSNLLCYLILAFAETSFGWTTPRPTSLPLPAAKSVRSLSTHQGSRFDCALTLFNRQVCDEIEDESTSCQKSSLSRRNWFQSVATASATASASLILLHPSNAFAASPRVVTNRATCDATVTVWKRGDRLVYLLGTAHISELSAQLASDLVRQIKPNAVFVELDLKRVGGGAVSKSVTDSNSSDKQVVLTMDAPIGNDGKTVPTRIIIPNAVERQRELLQQQQQMQLGDAAVSTSKAAAPRTLPPVGVAPTTRPARRGLGSMIMDASTASVGNAIRGMYQNLDNAGFKPGDEFAMAIRQGQAIGSDIVLGDQDVELTLQRLTQALAATDLKRLLQADSEIEESMKALVGGPTIMSNSSPDSMKQDLTTFVESIKSRESVRSLLTAMRKIAPALVQVMLTERDAYMAAGIDSLTQETVMVAVMGIAHVDGVEDNLKRQGWSQVNLNCARYAK